MAESLSAEARPAEETGANPSLNEEIEGPLSSRQEQQFTTRGAEREESPSRVGGRSDLTAEEEEEVRQLRERDREVREHEAAHVAAAGGLAGNPTYTLVSGPDNRQYAVGGEVQIDTSEGVTPRKQLTGHSAFSALLSLRQNLPSGPFCCSICGANGDHSAGWN